jgi:hypothetical protein
LGGYKAIIEGDTFSAIQWRSGKSPFPWRLADLVEEVQDIFSNSMALRKISFPMEIGRFGRGGAKYFHSIRSFF